MTVIHVEHVDRHPDSPAKIMTQLLKEYNVPKDKQMLLFTSLRLAASFSDYNKRLKCVQARLQALSVLIYSNQLTENVQSLLYSGLLEELVEVLEMGGDHLMEIKAAALKVSYDTRIFTFYSFFLTFYFVLSIILTIGLFDIKSIAVIYPLSRNE